MAVLEQSDQRDEHKKRKIRVTNSTNVKLDLGT